MAKIGARASQNPSERKSLRKGAHVTPLLAETAGGCLSPACPCQPDWQAQSLFMLAKAPPATAPLAHSWLAKVLPTGELRDLRRHWGTAHFCCSP